MILGFETPRIFTPPRRELTEETTHGFACIAFAEEVLEVKLFPWQRWLLLHALELDEGPACTGTVSWLSRWRGSPVRRW
jgi:hypothetical protein